MISAVIFDFDGVLFDTEPLHFEMFQEVLRTEGILLTWNRYHERYVGLTDEACFRAVLADHGRTIVSTETVERLVRAKTERMQRALCESLPVLPGVKECVESVQATHRTAIASGALREEILLCLELAGMTSMFEHVSAAQDVRRGKPHPELYRHALAGLNRWGTVSADACLAVEDTPHGIEAAHQAGLRCIAVATTLPIGALTQAEIVIPSLQSAHWTAALQQLDSHPAPQPS